MANAFIGLGGNVGDSRQILTDAVVCLAQIPFIQINARSCFYISKPVDAPGDDYINNVIAISTTLEPLPLLHACQAVEKHFGRERPFAKAPRTLDIDLLIYDDFHCTEPELIIPHPRITERMFVLLPLLELVPDIELPLHGKLRNKLPELSWQKIEILQNQHCMKSGDSNNTH
ncbi:MAG: 2-amino-4-hydroxy-6-hydroxymethyldihydropteridine diphosphokinase [Betaproteobacteria bacterium]|jgi:2-amino-4-hydroxy-6-hydroxymethyldihydropteridine diphosphokinase